MAEPAFDTLAGIEAWSLAALARAASQRGDPFRWPVLATTGTDGAPQARTVVLRRFDPQGRLLTVHTDLRAPKVAQLRAEPRACLVFLDAAARRQLRIHGRAEIVTSGPEHEAALAALGQGPAPDYSAPAPPGTEIAEPDAVGAPAEPAETLGLVRIAVDTLDWLKLDRDKSRRARIEWSGGETRRRWLVP